MRFCGTCTHVLTAFRATTALASMRFSQAQSIYVDLDSNQNFKLLALLDTSAWSLIGIFAHMRDTCMNQHLMYWPK